MQDWIKPFEGTGVSVLRMFKVKVRALGLGCARAAVGVCLF